MTRRDPKAVVENVQFLLEVGEHPDRIARRLETTVCTLARQLTRWGKRDLATPFERAYKASRHV
jgi:hypothetical protein